MSIILTEDNIDALAELGALTDEELRHMNRVETSEIADHVENSFTGFPYILLGYREPIQTIERHKTTTGSEQIAITVLDQTFNITITRARKAEGSDVS